MRRFLVLVCGLLLPLAAVQAQTPVKLKAGMVTGIDQVGLPIALERGFFEKQGLDVGDRAAVRDRRRCAQCAAGG